MLRDYSKMIGHVSINDLLKFYWNFYVNDLIQFKNLYDETIKCKVIY